MFRNGDSDDDRMIVVSDEESDEDVDAVGSNTLC